VASPTPRFSRLEADARRAQILAAAREAFAAGGLAGASMAEIATAAGVTRGLLNHYFGTKRELYLAVVAELASELRTLVRTDLSDLPVEHMVDLNASSWLDSVERNRDLWRAVLGVEAIGADEEVEAIMVAARDEVVERMAANQAGDGEPSDELRLVLRVYLGAAEAAAREWALRGRATREQAHAVLVGTLVAMIGIVLPQVPSGET
jgi:AcrR family transcriptional regulator